MKKDQPIGINGFFLRKPGSGIGQVTKYFLETLFANPENTSPFLVYVDIPEMNISLGKKGTLVYIKPWWQRDDVLRKLLWEHIQLPKKALKDGITNFLSLYQAPTEFPHFVRHVMLVHDVIPEIFPAYLGKSRNRIVWNLTKRAIKKANVILSVSQSTKRDLEKFLLISPEKIQLAYPSINPIFFQDPQTRGEQEKVLEKYQLTPGYLYHGGGLEIRKNAESLLTAYASWRSSAADQKNIPVLVISGTVHVKENTLASDVVGLIQKLQLEEVVILVGFVPDTDLPALYANASLFIFPSLYEGFGMPVLEALSQGTAVLATRNSSLGEVGGESVFWVESITKENLEKTYQQAAQDSLEAKSVRVLQAKNFKSWELFTRVVLETLIQ